MILMKAIGKNDQREKAKEKENNKCAACQVF
jgi:hypothetical protein